MDKQAISNWVRQARHRAKRYNIYSELQIDDIEVIIGDSNGCAYCHAAMNTLDHPFPLKDTAPNVAANVLPICKACKSRKKTHDLVWLFNNGYISQEKYASLLQQMLVRPGGGELREYVRKIIGIVDE